MLLEDLKALCEQLPQVTTDIKWEDHLCFNIGGKMFLVTAPDSVPVSASFKVHDERFEEFSSFPGCKPAAYLARYKWIYVDDIKRFSRSEWEQILLDSYTLIVSKLPVKKKKELGVT